MMNGAMARTSVRTAGGIQRPESWFFCSLEILPARFAWSDSGEKGRALERSYKTCSLERNVVASSITVQPLCEYRPGADHTLAARLAGGMLAVLLFWENWHLERVFGRLAIGLRDGFVLCLAIASCLGLAGILQSKPPADEFRA